MGEALSKLRSSYSGLKKGGKNRRRTRKEGGRCRLSEGGSTYAVMDKYRPKRPTTLALFPQLPQAGTQVRRLGGAPVFKMSWRDGLQCACVCESVCNIMGVFSRRQQWHQAE